MTQRWRFWLLNALGGIALVLVIANMVLYHGNREAQQAFATRAEFIQRSRQIEPLYRDIVRALAELAAKEKDEQIRQLLGSQGINVTVNPPNEAQAPTDGAPAAPQTQQTPLPSRGQAH